MALHLSAWWIMAYLGATHFDSVETRLQRVPSMRTRASVWMDVGLVGAKPSSRRKYLSPITALVHRTDWQSSAAPEESQALAGRLNETMKLPLRPDGPENCRAKPP